MIIMKTIVNVCDVRVCINNLNGLCQKKEIIIESTGECGSLS